jgi:hypothetical protein
VAKSDKKIAKQLAKEIENTDPIWRDKDAFFERMLKIRHLSAERVYECLKASNTSGTGAFMNVLEKSHYLIESMESKSGASSRCINILFDDPTAESKTAEA